MALDDRSSNTRSTEARFSPPPDTYAAYPILAKFGEQNGYSQKVIQRLWNRAFKQSLRTEEHDLEQIGNQGISIYEIARRDQKTRVAFAYMWENEQWVETFRPLDEQMDLRQVLSPNKYEVQEFTRLKMEMNIEGIEAARNTEIAGGEETGGYQLLTAFLNDIFRTQRLMGGTALRTEKKQNRFHTILD